MREKKPRCQTVDEKSVFRLNQSVSTFNNKIHNLSDGEMETFIGYFFQENTWVSLWAMSGKILKQWAVIEHQKLNYHARSCSHEGIKTHFGSHIAWYAQSAKT
jgi:hypothetical protein